MGDPQGLRNVKLKKGTARRVLGYTVRYRWMLIGFVAVPLWLSIALIVLYAVCVAVAWLVIAWATHD